MRGLLPDPHSESQELVNECTRVWEPHHELAHHAWSGESCLQPRRPSATKVTSPSMYSADVSMPDIGDMKAYSGAGRRW